MSEGRANLSGPMFEHKTTEFWESIYKKDGAHYNTFWLRHPSRGMEALKVIFPDAKVNEYNMVLFSTSGVHGTYITIEDIEVSLAKYGAGPHKWDDPEYDGDTPDDYCGNRLTFLVIHPRIVCMRYGNLDVAPGDIPYLKALRASSAEVWARTAGLGGGS